LHSQLKIIYTVFPKLILICVMPDFLTESRKDKLQAYVELEQRVRKINCTELLLSSHLSRIDAHS
jgi:hypothetical protein